MKITEELDIGPGEIWAVTGTDAAARSAWCARVVRRDDLEEISALLSFAQHAGEAQRSGGWPAARYYEDEGKTVDDFLSYESVYEINPFEIGARRPESKKAYNARKEFLMRLLDLRKLRESLVIALSNGETRRTLLARALAKGPQLLVLDDPAAGLDVKQRAKLREVLQALANRGTAILVACRHDDELPEGVAKWLKISGRGVPAASVVEKKSSAHAVGTPRRRDLAGTASAHAVRTPRRRENAAVPVVEIRDLDVTYGGRVLFKDFSWTVRKGERWILRGENGSGKTTLFALITGDSPLAYAADVTVFGQSRDIGCELAKIRRRIGRVSPEMQAYLGKSAEELLDDALAGKPELLLLDEPFMNLDEKVARRASRRIGAYLKAHKEVTAIMICHRTDEAPSCFDRELDLNG